MATFDIIQYLLDLKEWQVFECKRASAAPAKIIESVVALANSEGGLLVVGLEDPEKATGQARLIGVSESPDNVSELMNLIPKEITPPLHQIKEHDIPITNAVGAKDMLKMFVIERSTDVHSLKRGDTFVRRGRHNRKLTADEIIHLKYAKGAIKYESEPATQVKLEELDQTLLDDYKKYTGSQNKDTWQFLKDNGLTAEQDSRLYLNKACVLLFAPNPAISLRSKCSIKVSHYFGIAPNYSGEPNFVRKPFSIEGPLVRQIQETVKYFHEWLVSSPPRLEGAGFRRTRRYPEWVIQESIANAVIHRDYSVQDDTHVRIFDNRIEVESPGVLPGHVTVANIRRERFARNPIILRTLNRFGEEAPNLDIGEGVDRMFKLMTEANLYEPLYAPPWSGPNSVQVVLFNLERVTYWDTVSHYLDQKLRITNHELRKITGISDTIKASRLLKVWTKQGFLEQVKGASPKWTYYRKPGARLNTTLFA